VKTEVTSCDVCMSTMHSASNGANEYPERGGGFSLQGWEVGITDEYVSLDCCSVKCLAEAVAGLAVSS
jgi:hypothetical protein